MRGWAIAEGEVDLRHVDRAQLGSAEDRFPVDHLGRAEAEGGPGEHDAVGRSQVALGHLAIVLVGGRVGDDPHRELRVDAEPRGAVAAVDLAHDRSGVVPPDGLGAGGLHGGRGERRELGATLIEARHRCRRARFLAGEAGAGIRAGSGSDEPGSGSTTAGGCAAGGSGSGRADCTTTPSITATIDALRSAMPDQVSAAAVRVGNGPSDTQSAARPSTPAMPSTAT